MKAAGKDVQRVKLPDSVEYKFNLNQTWTDRLMALGVEEREQNFEGKEAAHIAQAEAIGREAFRYRKDISDSGVPVFGKEGLQKVSVYETFTDLLAAYNIVDVYIHPMRPEKNSRMRKLVVYFSNGVKRTSNDRAIETLLEFLSSSCWGFVHVWANPPGFTGKVKDTVNISHRQQDETPELVLRLAGGLWCTKTYVEPKADEQ